MIGSNNEINGLTLAGVGSNTLVRYCEVAFNLDDGFEMFGGVDLKYVSSIYNGDDQFDTDLGYRSNSVAFGMTGADGHHATEMDGRGRHASLCHNARFVGHLLGTPLSVSSDDLEPAVIDFEGTGGLETLSSQMQDLWVCSRTSVQ